MGRLICSESHLSESNLQRVVLQKILAPPDGQFAREKMADDVIVLHRGSNRAADKFFEPIRQQIVHRRAIVVREAYGWVICRSELFLSLVETMQAGATTYAAAAAPAPAASGPSIFTQLRRQFQRLLDASVPFIFLRWFSLFSFILVYLLRVYLLQGYYIVTYGLGIFLLNLLIGFLSPIEDADGDGPLLPVSSADEFKPFIRRLPEFKFWYPFPLFFFIFFFMCFQLQLVD